MLERKMGNLKKKNHNKIKITCLKRKNERKKTENITKRRKIKLNYHQKGLAKCKFNIRKTVVHYYLHELKQHIKSFK